MIYIFYKNFECVSSCQIIHIKTNSIFLISIITFSHFVPQSKSNTYAGTIFTLNYIFISYPLTLFSRWPPSDRNPYVLSGCLPTQRSPSPTPVPQPTASPTVPGWTETPALPTQWLWQVPDQTAHVERKLIRRTLRTGEETLLTLQVQTCLYELVWVVWCTCKWMNNVYSFLFLQ